VQKELPLFPAWRTLTQMADDPLTSALLMQTETFHVPTSILSDQLERVVTSLSVPSERTGAPLRVFPTRLRRTLATRAAREGYGSLVIAELLDHTDDQNARVYTENVPEHVDAINEAMQRPMLSAAKTEQAGSGQEKDLELVPVVTMGSVGHLHPSPVIRVDISSLGSMALTRRCLTSFTRSGLESLRALKIPAWHRSTIAPFLL
jgi:hypothetical protein